MVLVARLRGKAQTEVDDGGTEYVGEGFKAVGHQGEGVTPDAGRDFGGGEDAVHPQPGDDRLVALLGEVPGMGARHESEHQYNGGSRYTDALPL
jgi:hypothetical protein